MSKIKNMLNMDCKSINNGTIGTIFVFTSLSLFKKLQRRHGAIKLVISKNTYIIWFKGFYATTVAQITIVKMPWAAQTNSSTDAFSVLSNSKQKQRDPTPFIFTFYLNLKF